MDWQRLLLPRYWLQNESTDYAWDETLNHILDQAKNVEVEDRVVTIDGVSIWVSNYPYSYGDTHSRLFSKKMPKTGLPKVATRKRLRRFVQYHAAKQLKDLIKNRP